MIGGGSPPAPGEITLAHGGVLFLDELPEFQRATLEGLRQPLESGSVLVSRAGRQLELPARFQLVAAMNPCPCGYRGHPRVACRCPPAAVERYVRRVSGPLLDRIDLRVELAPPEPEELFAAPSALGAPAEPDWARLVARAGELRRARQGAVPNARLIGAELERAAPLDAPGRELLTRAARQRHLSARALAAVRRTARTLADLDGAPRAGLGHLAEALGLRSPLLEPGHG